LLKSADLNDSASLFSPKRPSVEKFSSVLFRQIVKVVSMVTAAKRKTIG